jgi:uroporphyrinogen-III synthase
MKILYLGSDPARFAGDDEVTHLQIIEIVPRKVEGLKWIFDDWEEYTHLLFTSKHAVSIFYEFMKGYGFSPKHPVIAVGQSTAKAARERGWENLFSASDESQEGLLQALKRKNWGRSEYILMPRSSLARGTLLNFLLERDIRHQVCDIYDTVPKEALLPDLEQFDQIFFSSPSTVHAFFSQIDRMPKRPKLEAIGPVTWQNLARAINIFQTNH